MRFVHAAVLLALSVSPALAQMGPYFVIPGRPDVPIFENGVDVSWSVVEGEYGLNRPNIVNPVIVYRMPPVVVPYPGRAALGPPYYPRDGMMPGNGRLEMRPPPFSPPPRPAQSYSRSPGGWNRRRRRRTCRRTIRTPSHRSLRPTSSRARRVHLVRWCRVEWGRWGPTDDRARGNSCGTRVEMNVASPDGGIAEE
jgi:hypothetical protein